MVLFRFLLKMTMLVFIACQSGFATASSSFFVKAGGDEGSLQRVVDQMIDAASNGDVEALKTLLDDPAPAKLSSRLIYKVFEAAIQGKQESVVSMLLVQQNVQPLITAGLLSSLCRLASTELEGGSPVVKLKELSMPLQISATESSGEPETVPSKLPELTPQEAIQLTNIKDLLAQHFEQHVVLENP